MPGDTAYRSAMSRFDRELDALVAEATARQTPATATGCSPTTPSISAHPDLRIHASIEVAQHVLAGLAPFELVAERMCPPANDHLPWTAGRSCEARVAAGGEAPTPFAALDYVPGPLQQAAIQLCASVASICVPALVPGSRAETQVLPSAGARLRGLPKALRAKAASIGGDVVLAGLADVVVEVVGWLTHEVEAVCRRLLRAMRHAMLPVLKGLRALVLPDRSMSYRESVDLALKLFVQAGIVGACVVAEHKLHGLLLPIFGKHASEVALLCMALLCWAACHHAVSALDRLDLAGAKRDRELRQLLAGVRLRRLEFGRPLNAVVSRATPPPGTCSVRSSAHARP